jgi:hypothetical protein
MSQMMLKVACRIFTGQPLPSATFPYIYWDRVYGGTTHPILPEGHSGHVREKKIEKGEFAEIKAWLTDKVHKHGKHYNSLDDLLEAHLGEKLNAKYFIQYLTTKYSELYKC